jgi:uncharacterized protein YbjT (DUF2867 family)
MIVVTAATGQIGSKLVGELLTLKVPVRALARDAKKLAPLAQAGAEVRAVDSTNSASLADAFRGADAVFLLIPPKYDAPDFLAYYRSVSESYVTAVRMSGARYVINLSSVGAQLPDQTGPIRGLYAHEQRMNSLKGVNIVHLRPAYFLENQLFNIPLIKSQGINGSPIRPDLAIPMIATIDIARAVASCLSQRHFHAHGAVELHGARDYTLAEVTRALGAAIGKPELPYVTFAYEDARRAMISAGLSPDVADLFNEMYRGFNDGFLKPAQPRSIATTTPTTLEEFSTTFAAVYRA